MIIFLGIESIDKKGEKKAGRYLLRLEAEPVSIPTFENEIEINKGIVEIDIDERLTRKLQDFAEFHKDPNSIKKIKIGETLSEQLDWENKLSMEIYHAFFPGSIGKTVEYCLDLLHQEMIDSLTLIIGSPVPWILDIPFEMMRKQKNSTPLSLCHENFHLIHSIKTGLSGFREEVLEASAPPLKILFVSALPVELPEEDRLIELEREQERLIAAVGELISKQKVFIEFLDIATLEEIEKALTEGQHQVVHFSGHGSHPEASSRDEGVLYLEDEWGSVRAVTGQELSQSLKKFSSIRMVVLSACETARAGESGVAGALLKAGLPAVLGMRYRVRDEAARNFTSCFYEDICAGKSLDYAVFSGRKMVHDTDMENIEIRKKQKDDSLFVTEWMTPFLYQDRNIRQLIDHTKEPGDTRHFLHKPQSPLVEGAKYVGRGFIGRHKEILYLYRLFREGHRSVCIYGQGGTGKTTLAVRFAQHFEKGAFRIIRFDNAVSEEPILSRLAEEATPSLGEGIKNFVQSPDYDPINKLNLLIEDFLSKQKIIILFDNFEENQIASQGAERKSQSGKVYQQEINSESLKAFLVHLCKKLKKSSYVLFTTRYRFPEPEIAYLNMGEMRFSDTFKLINRFEKLVQLSTKEKRQVHQKLGGHPRALELLESCVSHDEIGWESVNKKFQKVEEQEINQDLLMDMLWDKLNLDEKQVLKRASIFRELTPLKGLMVVTGFKEEKVRVALDTLNTLSLAYVEEQKCYIHRLTSSFVKKTKMDQNEIRGLHINAAEYFESIRNKKGDAYVEDLLEARWHYLEAHEWDQAAEMTISLGDFLSRTGYHRLLSELLKEIPIYDISQRNRSKVFHWLGILYEHFGDYDNAFKHHKNSMEIDKNIGNIMGISSSLHQIGNIYYLKGDFDNSLMQYEKAMEISEKVGNIKSVADSLGQIGNIYLAKGDYDKALEQYKKSMEISEKIDDNKGISGSLLQIGMIYLDKGDYSEALSKIQESLEISKKIDDIKGVSNCLHGIGIIYKNRGDYDAALELYEESLKKREMIGDIRGISSILHQIGIIYQIKGNYDASLKQHEMSLKMFEKIGNTLGISYSLSEIGNIYYLKGNYDSALMQYEKAMKFFEKTDDKLSMAKCFDQMGKVFFKKSDFNTSLRNFIKSFLIFSKIGTPELQQARDDILKVKKRIPEDQFNSTFKEFNISSDIFNVPKKQEDKFMDFLSNITKDVVQAIGKSEAEKEIPIQLINDVLKKIPEDTVGYKGIKSYLQMLLAFINNNKHIEAYLQKVPLELLAIFDKALDEKKEVLTKMSANFGNEV